MSKALEGVNKAQLALLSIILIAGIGFGYWKYMYSPAKLALSAANVKRDTAQQQVSARQAQLAQVQEQQVQASSDAKKNLGKIIVSKGAVPQEEDAAEAMSQVAVLARLSGVTVTSQAVGSNLGTPTDITGAGATINMTIEAHSTYGGLSDFLKRIQEMVDVRSGKLYVKGRLMSITSLKIGQEDTNVGGALAEDSVPADHITYTLTVQIYSGTASAPAASPTAPSTDPNAAGGAPAGSTPGSTTPTGTTTNPAEGGATTPTGQPTGGTTPTTPTTPTSTTNAPAESS